MRINGKAFAVTWLPQDSVVEDVTGRLTVTRVYRTLYSDWATNSPRPGSEHPIYKGATLQSKSAKQIMPGFLCDVTLTFVRPETGPANPNAPLPPDEYTQSVADIEAPIEAHPQFATYATTANGALFTEVKDKEGGKALKFTGWTANSPYAGILTFKAGSLSDSTTTYHWSRPSSVESLIGTASGNWLTISGSIQRRFPYWTRTINRIYSANGWKKPFPYS